ncbi:MAG TPA: penicillin-binding transpeptidase domain-containing protein [Bryobacteraceae bacterium]|nr:penicillin-binding transpeptidase domain-containing protein [Bryobacteraceae bacterium]
MKRYFFAPVVLVCLLQNLPWAAGQTKKSVPARRTVRKAKPAPPIDPTIGDDVDGDDLTIRRAAVTALGGRNGSVVVVDPSDGRVLTIVNQKLALQSGFIPCSTIKLVTSLAALSEHVVERESPVHISRYLTLDMDNAIAHSNNEYFGVLGQRLGFDRVLYYAKMLGLGEKAGLDIPGEEPGAVPDGPPKGGGMVLETAYGEGFLVTPLELAAMLSAIANGGTLYYLQYPRQVESTPFTPQVKRSLELAPNGIADVRVGMRGAVDYGTAKSAAYDPSEPVLGKTGTCTDFRVSSHMGWFGSFNEVSAHQLVVVVMLMGTRSVSGGVAAGVAGAIYRNLAEQRYFAADTRPPMPQIITTTPCCGGR